MKKLLILLSFNSLLLATSAQNQNKIDSLKQIITTEKVDTNLIKTYLELGNQYKYSKPDTAIFYYNKAIKIAQKENEQTYLARCYRNMGVVHKNFGNYKEALSFFNKALNIFNKT